MKRNTQKRVTDLLQEIRRATDDLPEGKQRLILNRVNRLAMVVKKSPEQDITLIGETHEQIAERESAKMAIFQAMCNGREITLEDSKEFRVSQMHSQMCYIRKMIQKKNLPFSLEGRWVETRNGKRIKAYRIDNAKENNIENN